MNAGPILVTNTKYKTIIETKGTGDPTRNKSLERGSEIIARKK